MIIIRNEDDLSNAVNQLRGKGEYVAEPIQFEGYPRFEITLRGERFDGGIPTRIMPALLELQRTLDRATANALGVVRLDKSTLQRAEIVVRVESGSTSFVADFVPILNSLVAKMSSTEAVVTLLGFATIAGGSWAWKAYLNHRAALHGEDVRARLTEKQIELTKSLHETPSAHFDKTLATFNKMLHVLGRRLEDGDQMVIQGEQPVDGATAKQLLRKPREEVISDRLDGIYMILDVASGGVREGYWVNVVDVDTDNKLRVYIPDGALPLDQLEELKAGEWGKRPLHMQINVRRRGERIVNATLVRAGLESSD